MNTKLYVGNLPLAAEEPQLLALFGANGRQVASVRILNDKATGRSRGFGFVEMTNSDDAQRAIEALHGHDFLGRPLTVIEAREQPPRNAEQGFGGRGFGGGHGRGGQRGGRGGARGGDRY